MDDYGYDYGDYDYGGGSVDYTGPTSPGQGGYSVNGQWYPIEAPAYSGQYSPEQLRSMQEQAYAPTKYTSNQVYDPATGKYVGEYSWMNLGQPSLYSQVNNPGAQPTVQGPSRGQRSLAQQTPQQIGLGQPQDELYRRYKSLLMNPDFSGDPTYQFLYNQGLQALNRNLAAQRQTLSGKSMNDTLAYGAGMASKYMQDLLPQYRGGAQEELNRFMGPAGLLPNYARTNNAAIAQASGMTSNADFLNNWRGYDLGLDRSGFTASGGNGIGWGGVNNQQNLGARPAAPPSWGVPRPLSFNENYSPSGQFNPYYDGYDIEGGPAYG